jgi:hypothetical protein
MENQNEILEQVTANPATLPTPNPGWVPKRPEAYTNRIRKMSDKAIKAEVIRQGKAEMNRSNGMGVILATALDIMMKGHIDGRAPYVR